MKRICPITFEWTEQPHPFPFTPSGLRRLSPHLKQLQALEQSHDELRALAVEQKSVHSFPGSQAKTLMTLAVKQCSFIPDAQRGRYLIKPQDALHERVPENEAITLHLASVAGIETAPCGLIDTLEPSAGFALWSRRLDRVGQGTTLPLIPFASLLPDAESVSMESMVAILNAHTTFPMKERAAFFQTVLFNFLVGNSGMHAGKWHLLTDASGITRLAPRFGLRNTQLTEPGGLECSLPLGSNGHRVDKATLLNYLGQELLGLPESFVNQSVNGLLHHSIAWKLALERSYLLPRQKFDYQLLLTERCNRLR